MFFGFHFTSHTSWNEKSGRGSDGTCVLDGLLQTFSTFCTNGFVTGELAFDT